MILHANWAIELQISVPKFSSQFLILHIKPVADYGEHLCTSLVHVLQGREFLVGNYTSHMVYRVGS